MKKVMVFGVFDLLHSGHIIFLTQAKKLGTRRRQGHGGQVFLTVSVARDKNVKKAKGFLPVFSEKNRIEHIKRLKIANKVMLGALKDPWPHILKEKPDIIALGYDQKPYVTHYGTRSMEQELQKRGLKTKVVRLKAYKPKVFKSSILRKHVRR